jgi:hypothetical protein
VTELEQTLADAIVERFVARCEKLWPGCKVTVRQTKQTTEPAGGRQHEEEQTS